MRRISLILGLMLMTASLGCKHVAGKCDCQAHPADAAPQQIMNPYPAVPVAPAAKPGN